MSSLMIRSEATWLIQPVLWAVSISGHGMYLAPSSPQLVPHVTHTLDHMQTVAVKRGSSGAYIRSKPVPLVSKHRAPAA